MVLMIILRTTILRQLLTNKIFTIQEKDFDKIKSEIGWRPRKTLEQTLDDIYDFYNGDRYQSIYELCLSQIKNYYNRI